MIERFLIAQEEHYETALAEIKAGKKESHWMWFMFPQIHGLGVSDMSRYYSIKSRKEVEKYLKHPLLMKRLVEMCYALLDLKTDDPVEVFGSIDAVKLQSSMTLFYEICEKIRDRDMFAAVLIKYFRGEKDWATMQILKTMEG